MTCRDVEGWIARYDAEAVPPAVAEHVAVCETCRGLVRVMASRGDVAGPSPSRMVSIKGRLLGDLAPVRVLPPAPIVWLCLTFGVVLAAGFGVRVSGGAGWRALDVVQRVAVFAALGGSAILLSVAVERQMVPASRAFLSPVLLATGVPVAIAGIVAVAFHAHRESGFVTTGLECLGTGVAYSVIAGSLIAVLVARGANLRPLAAGATAGALAGIAGLVVLEIVCKNLNAYHILVWHLGVLVVSIVVGIAIGCCSVLVGERLRRG